MQHRYVLVFHSGRTLRHFRFDLLITGLVQEMNVSHAFHGHLHEHIFYRGTPWAGLGHRSVDNLAGKVVIAPIVE